MYIPLWYATVHLYSNNHPKQVIPTGSANRLFLTEDGLYEVLMQSRKPIAKAFRKEVKQNIKSYRFKRCLSDKQQLKGIVDTDTLTKMGYAKQILMNLNLELIF